ISRGRPVRALDAGLALWPDLERTRVSSRFHSNLYRLRRALGPDIVIESQGRFGLNPNVDIYCDLSEFEKLYRCAIEDGAEEEGSNKARDAAIDLYQGPFAEEFFSEWSNATRQTAEAKFVRLLLAAADDAADRNGFAEA